MKFLKSILLALAILVSPLVTPEADAGQQDFRMFNRTSLVIYSLHVSPSASDVWGNDVLGDQVVTSRGHVDVTFSDSHTSTYFDIKVTTSSGSTFTFQRINLKANTFLYFGFDPSTGQAALAYE